ncbi:hypothetical protein KEM54_006283 [Ascosphaera aggregata]|nr:hypothetical protein KEM54_006283 [Ascosphaera aggregata]
MLFAPLLISFMAAATTYASSLTINIPPTAELPNPETLHASTHATLSALSHGVASDKLRARITRRSQIIFPDLSNAGPASYLLEIHAKDVTFLPYRVDISSNGDVEGVWDTLRGHQWEHKGVDRVWRRSADGAVTIDAKTIGRKSFYEQRPKFSPVSLLKNPMILLGVVALVITVGMPKLMDSIDPEYREEFEKSRKVMGRERTPATQAAHAAAGFDFAGWMAGATAPSSGSGAATASGRQAASGDQRRRR